ncbi:unnamed protein product [Trifolium pratense]|uniref:Uncharacterized protein n=1 Tax=Trifolium pratense TaxID=57577 RepID=A0ACB0LVB3_TRIPR|nr:unnamed protein product [Trifolium pratense]
MNILVSVAEKVAEYIFEPVVRQAGYLIFYKGNLEILAGHVVYLEAERVRIIHSIEEERGNGKEIEKDVEIWLEKVNEVIERANQLHKDPRRANARCSTWRFPNLILRHQLSRKATKIAIDVIQVQGKGKFDRVGHLPIVDGVASSSTRGGEIYETRESLKNDILKALADLNSCNIGVYGLGGVGKTTLVEEVAQISKQRKLFDKVVITHVSKNPDFKTIQGEIADLLGLQFKEETIFGRANRLRQRIKMEKSILLILDNICTKFDLKKVGIPFGKEHNGCKLLMTSINHDVLLQMDVPEDFIFKLELMRENETWSLFQIMAGDVVKKTNLKDVAFKVSQKCEGLPLRVVMVASAMKDKRDVQSWEYALRKLESNDGIGMDPKTYSALELSYNLLESDEMRDVFLLFSLLLGNDVEYFLKVAMGLKIIKLNSTMEDARARLYTIIKSLEACLLLFKTNGKIQMQDYIRDFATSVACRDKHVFLSKQPNEDWPTDDFLKRCTQIVINYFPIHKLPETFNCPNIKFFCLGSVNRSLEIPDNFFEGMGSLTTLDLSCLNLSSLPTSVRFLTDLKMMCLFSCVLENMDAIEALQNLEILHLWQCSMIKLPREIGKLTKLRMLDLTNSGIEVFPPNILSSLTKLEELYMGDTSINWGHVNSTVNNGNASIVELQKLPNLTALELQIRETSMLPRELQLMFEKLKYFKIAIGDVWDWADIKDGTLKTLMLKLGTNIHLEHGIKALIKRVENLYLDDVDGIQNVLYNLSADGFPLLKHLHVQNNGNMKHIVNSKERNQIHVSFPILETLVLHNLKNLEHICHGPLSITSFGSLSVIKVNNCVQLKYLFSFTMAKGLSQLSKIEVFRCNSMKEIVLGDNNSSANNDITNEKVEFLQLRSLTLEYLETLDNFFSHYLAHSKSKQNHQGLEPYVSTPFFNAQVAFPNLHTLKLSSLLKLNKIWDDTHHSMFNLTSLTVDNCGGLMYLFSSTVVASFKNLEHLEITNCPMMEEIIAKDEGNRVSNEVHFSKLEKIILKDMDNLKTIWHHQFEALKMLQVNNCNKIVVVFPSSMQKTYNKLEMLEVTNCALVEAIFELNFNESSNVEDATHLKEVTIDGLYKLKKIWSGDPQGILSFQNLRNVKLNDCASLEYLLPLSVATGCSHLKELHIIACGNMTEIVAADKVSSVIEAPIIEFNQLSTLLLWQLSKLRGFYAGNHTLACPSLKITDVFDCAKLNLYRPLSTRSFNIRDDKLSISMQQPPFIVEEVIPNIEQLRINHKEANMILQAQNSSVLFTKITSLALSGNKNKNEDTFPYWFLQNMRSLESLVVERSCFKKIFQDEGSMSEETRTKIKILTLSDLPNLEHICEEGFQIDPVLEFLEYLEFSNCSSLINLLPSSVTFAHLEYLVIKDCKGLTKLITSSTAQSLNKLISLEIEDCTSLEEIIIGEENFHITFISLQVLMLECLPSLNQFCSSKFFLKFPLLEFVIVRECPRMKVFSEGYLSTPNLRKVKIAENDEQWFWKGNLNDTINKMFEDKVAFGKFKYLALSDYPEMKDLWYGQVDQNLFCNLKHLVVNKCDFLSHVLFPSNVMQVLYGLEELEVTDCDSLEAVFDVKGMKSKDTLIKQSTQLKTLTLSNLPKLKHIWNDNPHEIISFGNLCTVNVSMCQILFYIFSSSQCQDLEHLEMLNIESCGVEQIVGMDEEISMEINFNFPHLNELVLYRLTNLKSFYQGKYSLECPSLKVLNVYRCEALRMFSFIHKQPNLMDISHDILSQQALFSIDEKLSPNLEELAINGTDMLGILNGYCQENVFHKVEFLRLQSFDESPTSFMNEFHKIFPNHKTLQVRNSSFEILFPIKRTTGHLSMKNLKQVTHLWVYDLEKLEHIWEKEFLLDHPLLQDLEELTVSTCPSLISLVPSSASFTNLTSLEVANCKELLYLTPSSTARSLVQLKGLAISNCEKMIEIVKIDEENADKDIIFENLETMKFTSLSSLTSFCYEKHTIIFPSLLSLTVQECPQMEIFSSGVTVAPYLTEIEVEEETIRWKDDINTTIQQLFLEKEVLRSNVLNETIVSSHLQDEKLVDQDDIEVDPEEGPTCHSRNDIVSLNYFMLSLFFLFVYVILIFRIDTKIMRLWC